MALGTQNTLGNINPADYQNSYFGISGSFSYIENFNSSEIWFFLNNSYVLFPTIINTVNKFWRPLLVRVCGFFIDALPEHIAKSRRITRTFLDFGNKKIIRILIQPTVIIKQIRKSCIFNMQVLHVTTYFIR